MSRHHITRQPMPPSVVFLLADLIWLNSKSGQCHASPLIKNARSLPLTVHIHAHSFGASPPVPMPCFPSTGANATPPFHQLPK